MANPYSSVSISGYNSSPPPDDGSNTAANEIKWATHKNKIGDPLKTAIESINSNVSSAFGKIAFNGITTTGVDYAVLTSDQGKLISCTNTITVTLPAAATVSTPFMVAVKNAGTGTVTVDGDGDETIDGSATITIAADGGCILVSDGSGWTSALQTSNTFNGNVTVQSDDAGASVAPILSLNRNSASPAANDTIGRLSLDGKDDAGNDETYAEITGAIVDPTSTSEDGQLQFQTVIAGTLANRLFLGAGLSAAGATGGDKGANSVNFTTYYENGTRFYGRGAAKAWVIFNSVTTTSISGTALNISSVTDNGTGDTTLGLSPNFADTNYSFAHGVVRVSAGNANVLNENVRSVSGLRLLCLATSNGVAQDASNNCVSIFGDY